LIGPARPTRRAIFAIADIALPRRPGDNGRTPLAALNEGRLRRVLHRMLDEGG
jgi:hypothetical protein